MSIRELLCSCLGILLIAACAVMPLSAQSTNNQQISGVVLDSTGAVVPSATVTAVNSSTNFSRSATSNASGNYVISNVPIGNYSVSGVAQGFKKFVLTNVGVTVDSKVTVNVKLEVGNVTEAISVQADAVRVEASSGQVGRLVTGQQATQLQLNGRNFPQLLALIPGVSTTYSSGFGLFGGYGVNNSGQSANGGRTDTFSWNLDGVDNKDNGGGGNNFVNINPDALAEFRVLTTNYSAEYGYSSGAVVNLALKSGTTQFHGIGYEYFRNNAIQARAFNAPTIPELRYNNFGWNLGGPIYIPKLFNTNKDKLFFFVGEDFKRLRQGAANTWTVPSVAQKNGDFSALPPSKWPLMPGTKTPYPNGIIPASQISPNSTRLLDNYPAPNFNGSGGNYVFNTVAPLNTNEYIYKVDYNMSSRNQFNVHYVRDYYTSTQDLTQLILYNRNIPGTNTAAQWTFVPNSTTVNIAQFSFSGNVIFEKTGIKANPLFINDFTRAGQGYTAPSLYNASNAIPTIGVSGYTTLTATPLNFNNFNRIFDWKDDFSKVIGNHSLKLGILIMRSRKNQDNVPAINGTFNFSPSAANTTGNPLADAVLGNFYTYTEASSLRQGWYRFWQVEPYIQDDWKATSRLTLNLGLRYQWVPPQYSALNNTTSFLPQYYDAAQAPTILRSNGAIVAGTGNPYNGLVLPGSGFPDAAIGRIPDSITGDPAVKALFHGLPQGLAHTDTGTWGPRFGFAYDLTGNDNTVLRGGYGIFYERLEGNYLFSAVNNPPFIQQALIYNGNVENPGGGALQNFPSTINNSHYLDMKVPRTMNWSLGIQRKLSRDTLLDVAYVGSSAANLSYQGDVNQLPLGTVQANPGVNSNALRPYLGYADIYQYITGANFIYNSLQVQLKKQMGNGGLINVAYTWSKGRTDANSYNYQPMDSYNLRGDWGPSSYNRNQIFVLSYVYPLPFWRTGQEWYKRAFGGWQLSGVTTLQSGLPLNVTVQGDVAGISASGSNQRPNLVGDVFSGTHGTQFLNSSAFAVPTAGTFGNLGAYAIFGPGTNNWDASLQKDFPLTERVHADFRTEFFDFPNHLSYATVATTLGSSNFGQVTGATDPRTLEFALRVRF
ncbi:MAG TPA: carboxypeptidase regulatory-like domain-containing protein [Bryobacteraceae bacterium]|nr:carboxypeptidase regulatory-like domain-containing protein [Bryobacteraceae bacterium]